MRIRELVCNMPPWTLVRSVFGLTRGVRIHPKAVLFGRPEQVIVGRGSTIGARTRVLPGPDGQVVIGERVWLAADIEIQTDTRVRIGDGTTVQRRCTINGTTRLGRGCILAPNVFISSGTHPFRLYAHLPIREQERRVEQEPDQLASLDRPVWVQDDCWLAANVVICPGVTVGKGSVIGANSVVTRDVAPYKVVAGTPARVIGERLSWRPPEIINADREEDLVYVLSGVPVRDAGGSVRAIEITGDEPMCVAISPSNAVCVYYRASGAVKLRVADRVLELPGGAGSLRFLAAEFPIARGALIFTAYMFSCAPEARIEITRIAAEPAARHGPTGK